MSSPTIRDWRPATVLDVSKAADDILSIRLKPEVWLPHLAGQHYELRLPEHHLSRKYSIVSSPGQTDHLEFGVQLLSYGLVSPLLWKLKPGDKLDIRGPLGAFVWTPDKAGPLIMVGAGSGITPFLGMYEHFRQTQPDGEVVLLVSAKDESRVMHYAKHRQHLTTRFTTNDGRIDKAFLERYVGRFANNPAAYCLTCGPGGFTGHIIDLLLEIGFDKGQVRRETFN